jgi:hypothetical protein
MIYRCEMIINDNLFVIPLIKLLDTWKHSILYVNANCLEMHISKRNYYIVSN